MSPAGHLVHEEFPLEEINPAGQLLHDWWSISYLPAGHASHFEAPEVSETFPGSHSKQLLLAASEYFPEPHFVQGPPAREKEPSSHGRHVPSCSSDPAGQMPPAQMLRPSTSLPLKWALQGVKE